MSTGGEREAVGPVRKIVSHADLRAAWDSQTTRWIAWARAPMHDSYWRFHRDQFLEVLPAPGRLTIDIGAGEGRLSRDLATRGHNVVSVDGAAGLVAAAKGAAPSISAVQADAARLPVRDAAADLVIAFMSLQDVDDMPAAIAEAARVLENGARLCFAIVHPLNSAGQFAGDRPDSPFTIEGTYLEAFAYEDYVVRDGHEVTFASEHRPLESYFAALSTAGFVVENLREPPAPDDAVDSPRARRWQRVPLFLHVVAVRRERASGRVTPHSG